MRAAPSRWLGWPLLLAVAAVVVGLAGLSQALRPRTLDLDPLLTPLEMGLACEAVHEEGADPARAPLVRAVTLVTCPQAFDGRVVRVQGETVGDLIGRGERRWVLVNDDDYATHGPLELHGQSRGTNSGVAVLLPEGTTPPNLGGPGRWGTRVEVTGTFRRAAQEDQGGPAVLADDVRILAPGGTFPSAPVGPLAPAAALALAVGASTWTVVLRRRRGVANPAPRRHPA